MQQFLMHHNPCNCIRTSLRLGRLFLCQFLVLSLVFTACVATVYNPKYVFLLGVVYIHAVYKALILHSSWPPGRVPPLSRSRWFVASTKKLVALRLEGLLLLVGI